MLTGFRQRGANWRNDGPGAAPAAGLIGAGDSVDREYAVSNLNSRLLPHLTLYSHSCKNLTVAPPAEKPPDASSLAQVETLTNLLKRM